MSYPLDYFSEPNRLTGYALWTLLDAVTPGFCSGGVRTLVKGEPAQEITISFEVERDPELPCDTYQYEARVVIHPGKPPGGHELTLTHTTTDRQADVMTEVTCHLTVFQFLQALPFIKAGTFEQIRPLLRQDELTEYVLSDLQQRLGMPKSCHPGDK